MPTTGVLSSIAEHTRALYRLLGLVSTDDVFTEQGEAANDVAYLALTDGYRRTQNWIISKGGGERWRKRASTAITAWTGSDASVGGRYVALADYCLDAASNPDFLRLDSKPKEDRSALVEANGDQWGSEIEADEDWAKGDYYYLKGEQLWLARTAGPPSTLYLRYYYKHPRITSATSSFDMDEELRWLCVAEAADAANRDGWGVEGAQARIDAALAYRRSEAKRMVRRTRNPRRMEARPAIGTHW